MTKTPPAGDNFLTKFGPWGLGLYGLYKAYQGLTATNPSLDATMKRGTVATTDGVTPSGSSGSGPSPTSSGGGGSTGSNMTTPDQVKKNLEMYPNSSGYNWGAVDTRGQYRQGSGVNIDYQSALGPDGVPIAQRQAEYFNQRGMATAAQNDLDINSQLMDRTSPLYRAYDRMTNGQLTQFRLGNEESQATYDANVREAEERSKERMRLAEQARQAAKNAR
jgi:hypothetical protein